MRNLYITADIEPTTFCPPDIEETSTWGTYTWPQTSVGSRSTLPCQLNGSLAVARDCLEGGTWAMAAYGGCALLGLKVK